MEVSESTSHKIKNRYIEFHENLKVLLIKRHYSENEKISHSLEENINNTYIWQKDLYVEYMKNYYNLMTKKKTIQ